MLFILLCGCNSRNDMDIQRIITQIAIKDDFSKEIDSLNNLLSNDNQNINYLIERGIYFASIREDSKAKIDIEEAYAIDNKNINAKIGMIYYLQRTGNTKKSIELINEIISIDPGNGLAYYFRANTYNNPAQGLDDVEKCLNLTKDFETVYLKRGIFYFLMDSLEKALIDFNYLVKKSPNTATYYNMRSMVYEKQKDYDKILENYDLMWGYFPGYRLGILKDKVDIYEKMGDVKKMNECLELIEKLKNE